MTSVEPSNPRIHPSRWHTPLIYPAAVAVFLLISLIIAIIIAIVDANSYSDALQRSNQTGGLPGGLLYLFVIPWLFVLAVLSISGAILLLLRRKNGIYVSFAALIFMTITLPISFAVLNSSIFGIDPDEMPQTMLPVYSSFGLSIMMFPILFLAWKRVQWV